MRSPWLCTNGSMRNQNRMSARTVVKIPATYVLPSHVGGFTFFVPQMIRNEVGYRMCVQFIGHGKSFFFAF